MTSNKNIGTKGLVSLIWNEYDSFVISGFSTLYQNDDLADVTLICEGRSFKAHRVILSVWSTYFREIFISNPSPNPIVILRQTSSEDFELILRFMYQGKILVPQDDADRFLKTAENFKIAGLGKMKIQCSVADVVTPTSGIINSGNPEQVTAFIDLSPISNKTQEAEATTVNFESLMDTEVSIESEKVIPITNSNNKSTLSHHRSVSAMPLQTTPLSNMTVEVAASKSISTSGGLNSSIKPFPIFQRNKQKGHSNQAAQSHHSTVIGSTTIRQIGNYPILDKISNKEIPGSPSSDVANFSQQLNLKHEEKPVMESVMVLQNFIPTNEDVQALVDPLREDTCPDGIFGSVYNSLSGPHKQKMIQIQNQSDGTIIGYTFIPDDQGSGCTGTLDDHSQNIVESPLSSSTHSHSDGQCPEVIDLDVDETVAGGSIIMEGNTSEMSPMVPVTTTAVSAAADKPSTARRRPKKRKGGNNDDCATMSDADEDNNKEVDERVACPTCGKIVKKTSLKVHMKRSHLEAGVVLLCPICGKQVSSKGVYYKHMYMHRRKSEFPSENDGMEDFENEDDV